MDQLCTSSSPPVTPTPCTLSTAAQPGTPQRRVVILPARGSISPVKVTTSPKHIVSPRVFTSGSGSPLPIHTNCGLVDNKFAGAVSVSDSVHISSCVSQCIVSTSHGGSSEPDDKTLSATLQVDGILTSGSENASRYGIVSVAGRESGVQETSVLSPVTSITRLPAFASGDSCSASLSHVCMYQSSSTASQICNDKISGTQAMHANCETSAQRCVALVSHPVLSGPQTVTNTRTVNVTSIRKICPSANVPKRNVVVKLFAENAGSLQVHTAEQGQRGVTSANSAKSPKRLVLLRSTAAESTSIVCAPSVMQQSDENIATVNETTVYQPCPSLQTVNPVVTSAAKATSATLRSTMSCVNQNVSEAVTVTLNGSQNNPMMVVDHGRLSTVEVEVSTENSSHVDTESEDDSDDDSVVIIDADLVPSSPSPSPSRNSTKRSLAAQNVILLNHHKSSSSDVVDSKPWEPKPVVTDRTEQSRTKRKSALGTRLLESVGDEGIILPASPGFENGARISHPNRRKSFPQRRTDASIPQLQFCTKQWKRDISSGHYFTPSPVCKRSQSRSPKKDTGSDLLDKADRSTGSVVPLSQSNLHCSENSYKRRKRKPVDQSGSSAVQEVKRSKRLLPVKAGNARRNKNMETSDSIVHKDAAVKSEIIVTSSSADLSKAPSNNIAVTVSSCSFNAFAADETTRRDSIKTTEPATDSASDLQVLGKDKRSMEMSVTNEDGVVENLVVTIIDISSSEEEEDNDEVEIRSVSSSAKLDSSEVSMPEVETSQLVTSKSLISNTAGAEKSLPDKSYVNSSILIPDCRPVSETSKRKPIRRKCRKTIRNVAVGRKVTLTVGRTVSSEEHADVTKVKQLTQLHRKSNNRKRSKTDAGGTVKLTKAESDSVSAGYLGPVVRLHGSKDSPTSCSVVSGVRDVDDEVAARLTHRPVMLSSSCYPTSFQLRDSVPWKCVFCHQGSSYRTLGDLFGPYFAKADNPAKSDISPSKSRSYSKKSQESSCTVVSQNSQRRRQKFQKYTPPVARKSPQKSPLSPDKGIPAEIWLHENCAVWTSGICLSPTGQLSGLEAAITLSLQTVHSFDCFYLILYCDYRASVKCIGPQNRRNQRDHMSG